MQENNTVGHVVNAQLIDRVNATCFPDSLDDNLVE